MKKTIDRSNAPQPPLNPSGGVKALQFILALLLCGIFLILGQPQEAYSWPDTGQEKCYQYVTPFAEIPCHGTGQDGAYSIHPLSSALAVSGSGSIEIDSGGWTFWQRYPDDVKRTYSEAEAYCAGLNLDGHSWHLPYTKYLLSIADYGKSNPSINQSYFPGTKPEPYWTRVTGSGIYYAVDFKDGTVLEVNNSDQLLTRCDWGDAFTITYSCSSNWWGTDMGMEGYGGDGEQKTWHEALKYCNNLNAGSYGNRYADWRLPNVKEAYEVGMWGSLGWPLNCSSNPGPYWTSTTNISSPDKAYYISLDSFGSTVTSLKKTDRNGYAYCIRGSAYGANNGSLSISPQTMDFGSLPVGYRSNPMRFIINNPSQYPASIAGIQILGTNPNDFSIAYDYCTGLELAPGQQCSVYVVFSPLTDGLRQATLAGSTLTGTGGLSTGNSTISGKVTDSSGNSISGATVNVGIYSGSSGLDGSYSITGIPAGDYTLSVSKAGYVTKSSPLSIMPYASLIHDFVMYNTSGSGGITVNSITSKYNGFLYFLPGTDFNVTFTAEVDWAGHPPQTVQFITSKGTYDVPTTGDSASKPLNTGFEFFPCTTLSVVAVSSDGYQSAPKEADFNMMSPIIPITAPFASVDLGDGFFYQLSSGPDTAFFDIIDEAIAEGVIPADIPLFGQSGFNLRMVPSLEAKVESDGTAEVGLEWENKSFVKGKIAGFEFELNPKVSITGEYRHPGCYYDWSGYVGLSGSVEISKSWPFIFMAGPVPVPMYAKASFELSADATGTVHNIDPLDYTLNLELQPYLRGSLGVGADSLLAVEGWIGGGATVGFQYPQSPHMDKFEIFLNGGVSVYALLWEWENEALRWDWDLMNPSPARIAALKAGAVSGSAPSVNPKLVRRDYLQTSDSGRFSNRPKLSLNVPSQITPMYVSYSGFIQPSVYPYSESNIASNGTTRLAWVTDNQSRTAINRTMAVSSQWNGASWSPWQPIWDNGTADFHPKVITFPDGSAYATWEKQKIIQPDTAAFNDMARNLEVASARYNPASGTWMDYTLMSWNETIDRSPKISGPAADNVALSWIGNTVNNLMGSASAPNSVYLSYSHGTLWFKDTIWSQIVDVAQIPYPLLGYDLYFDGTNAEMVFSIDADGDLSTINDHELYKVTVASGVPGTLTRLTNDAISDDSPHITTDELGTPIVIWLRGGQLMSAPLSDTSTQTIIYTDEYSSNLAAFSLARSAQGRMAITWQEPKGGNPSDMFSLLYDPATRTWSAPRQLTNDIQTERGITTTFAASDTLMAVYNRNITGPSQGVSDLYMLMYTMGPDLALQEGSLTLSPQVPQPGQQVTITVTALNTGDTPASDVSVSFYDGDPSSGGVLLGASQIAGIFKPGDSAEVSYDWTVPPGALPGRVYAVIDPASAFDTENRSNNTVYDDIVGPDLSIQTVTYQMVTPTLVSITARILNKGNAPSAVTTVALRHDTANGALIGNPVLPGLGIGESYDVNLQMDISSGTLSYYTIFISADEGNAVAELDENNNTADLSVIIDNSCTYSLSATSITTTAAGAYYTVAITTNGQNCTWQASTMDQWIAFPVTASGAGTGMLFIMIGPNPSGNQRVGALTVGRQTVTITEAGLTHDLTLGFSGTGNGTVTIWPGKTCSADCTDTFSAGTDVMLYPSGQCSYFAGWGGACASNPDLCTFPMNSALQVSATFTVYPDVWNKTAGSGDALIQTVYQSAEGGSAIRLQGKVFNESVQFDRPVGLTLSGGFNCDFSGNSGTYSIINSPTPVVIGGSGSGSGTVTIENIVIQ